MWINQRAQIQGAKIGIFFIIFAPINKSMKKKTYQILAFTLFAAAMVAIKPSATANSQFQPPSSGYSFSEEARMSLLTASPGEALYSMFGHSALWVYDPMNNIDEVYNWGTFDFDTPYFYIKFLRGRLLYKLTVVPLNHFLLSYHYEGRGVYEQVLNLSTEEMSDIYAYLQYNRRPENIYYLYDFFFDNCATRVRDIIDNEVDVDWGPDPHPHEQRSFRDMVAPYASHLPWAAFGIDLLLGLPSDRLASPWHYMFLPDEMFIAFQHARHQDGSLLVSSYNEILPEIYQPGDPFPIGPLVVFWLLFVAGVYSVLREKAFYIFSRIFFFVLGLAGLLIFIMWFLSNHYATAMNLNILWALPTHLYFAFRIKKSEHLSGMSRAYFRLMFYMGVILMVLWLFIPQGFHPASFPLVALSTLFSARIAILKNGIKLPLYNKRKASQA